MSSADTTSFRSKRLPFVQSYFNQRMVYPWELPSIMRKHIYTGAMGNIWATLISGIFFVYFGTAIGLTSFQWGLMSGISSWLIAAQLVSASMTQRTGQRKLIWFLFAVAERSVRLAGILVSLWLWHAGWEHAGIALIIAICLANLFGTMSSPPWLSWLADIIPEETHGRFWGRRAAWIAVCVVAVSVPAGLFIDRIPEAHRLDATVLIFVVGTVIGLLDLLIHGTLPEPPPVVSDRHHFLHDVMVPLRDVGFRPWLIFNTCWTFSMTLGGALATIYFVQDLGIKNNFLGGAIVITSFTLLGSIATGSWSGKLVDRLGPKRVLFWGHLVWGFLPLFWVFAVPATALYWLGTASIVGGMSSTAATTAASKLITRFPPAERRAMYVAVSTSLANFAGGLGVMTAGWVLHEFGQAHVTLGGWQFGAYPLLFVASATLRVASVLAFMRRIPDWRETQPA
ncbi:MAG: hypothetical protein A3K19_21010 [Lentisphaerae bacterium RIFOXYB12_FULL_65_16]|nr:MAG: hypothetical protein A3K18_16505 [Lentisphaerae bacterium RIFOXYA12_64_32]OGV84813.1 MAG: hypothetical protein A3K19_21010 [Lentisphaerae bacterium RIFOXYB12_FULL_65_16]